MLANEKILQLGYGPPDASPDLWFSTAMGVESEGYQPHDSLAAALLRESA
jgi:hypothetical protein